MKEERRALLELKRLEKQLKSLRKYSYEDDYLRKLEREDILQKRLLKKARQVR